MRPRSVSRRSSLHFLGKEPAIPTYFPQTFDASLPGLVVERGWDFPRGRDSGPGDEPFLYIVEMGPEEHLFSCEIFFYRVLCLLVGTRAALV